jgi:hypothetical protein
MRRLLPIVHIKTWCDGFGNFGHQCVCLYLQGYAGVNQSCPQSHTHPYNYPATATATNDMTHYSQMTAASHPVPATYYYTPTMVDKQYYFDTPPMMEGEVCVLSGVW